jgi:hypothetical protein
MNMTGLARAVSKNKEGKNTNKFIEGCSYPKLKCKIQINSVGHNLNKGFE